MIDWQPVDRDHRRRIEVRAGRGVGPTEKAAFDAALMAAGVAQYNLVALSSVVPVGLGEIVAVPRHEHDDLLWGDWGDRLYCVLAESSRPHWPDWTLDPVMRPHTVVAAGIGWARHPDGRGVFVEHAFPPRDWDAMVGASPPPVVTAEHARGFVDALIEASLEQMVRARGWDLRAVERDHLVCATACVEGVHTCALVVACIDTASWRTG